MTTWRSGPELLSWRCAVVPRARWTRTAEGRWTGEVRPCAPNDLWATAAVPRTALAMSALENVVRLCARQGAGISVAVDPLTVGRITVHAEENGNSVIQGDTTLGTWKITSAASGTRVMTITGFEGPVRGD